MFPCVYGQGEDEGDRKRCKAVHVFESSIGVVECGTITFDITGPGLSVTEDVAGL